MPTIHRLDNTTIDKIAAGEVIERPVSAVKELVENALDAGASRIEITIINGGKTKVQVQDNGCGMTREDALLAIERHATSKLTSAADLFSIGTLGFRGEAIPSIASISAMTIRTKPQDAPDTTAGTELHIRGGALERTIDIPATPGTTIIVEDLFYNVPARLKFLKTSATELGYITALIAKFVLGHPHVAFTLHADGKTLINSPGARTNDSEALRTAAVVVLGAQIGKKMTPFETYSSAVKVTGLLASPTDTKADRSGEYFFANGRAIISPAISKALEESLRDKIPRGRFPIGIVFVEVRPDEIDVNVHPTKREVKFLKQNEVFTAVQQAVRNVTGIHNISVGAVEVKSNDPFIRMHAQHAQVSSSPINEQRPLLHADELNAMVRAQAFAIDASFPENRPGLHPVAQVNKTYIVALDGEDLVLIDQHVAHERVLYDRLLEKDAGSVHIQELLIPETIELAPDEYATVTSMRELLLTTGFRFEDFGGTTVILRSVPALVTRHAPQQVFRDIINEWSAHGSTSSMEKQREELLKMVACKGAIKAGEVLTLEEMRGLLRDLLQTAHPRTCPHGRPIIVPITKEELDKKFGR